MNIAIMFNGLLRWHDSFKRTFQSHFKPALEGHEVQYFAHFWNEDLDRLSEFIKIANPIILEMENKKTSEQVKEFLGFTKVINGTLPNQTYCAYKVFLLLEQYQKQHNKTFDLYIRMRSDLAFLDKINFDNLDSESVYIKSSHSGTSISNYLNDYMYFTKNYYTAQTMSKFGTCFDTILDDPRPLAYKEFISQNIYCPEELLSRYAIQNGLSVKLHNFNIDLARHHI